MKKLIATTALALIIGGPAVAQATQEQPADQQQATQDQQQLQAQEQQPVAADQQMTAPQGFYQPDANDLFVSDLMDAEVYAPAQRDAAAQPAEQPVQQDAAVQSAEQPVEQETAAQPAEAEDAEVETAEPAQPADDGAEVEVTVEDAEGETATETVETQPEAEADTTMAETEAEVQPEVAETEQDQQMQQAETDPAAEPQMQQAEGQMQMGDRAYGGGLQARTVTQDELGQHENIGTVSDMIVDEQGQLRAIVLDVGGFLGIGAREVALSVDEIEIGRDADNPEQIYIISRTGTDELESAPEFDREQLRAQREQQVAEDPQAQQQQETAETAPAAAPEQEQAQQQQWRGDREQMAAPAMQREGYQQAEAAEITADNLLGANVYDVNDENIGSVNDIVMGADGQVEYAVIDVGGFLGFGTHTVAIGFDEMQILHDEGWADLRVYVDVTQEQLENMPEYQQN